MRMIINEFNDSEKDDVVNLWERCSLTAPQNDPYKDIQRKLKVDPDLFLVGKIDGKVVASVMGGYEGHRGWINYLAVDPDFRRMGLGKKIMDEIELRLRAKGCPKINLQVRESNVQVIEFYEALGFKNDNVISFGKRLEED